MCLFNLIPKIKFVHFNKTIINPAFNIFPNLVVQTVLGLIKYFDSIPEISTPLLKILSYLLNPVSDGYVGVMITAPSVIPDSSVAAGWYEGALPLHPTTDDLNTHTSPEMVSVYGRVDLGTVLLEFDPDRFFISIYLYFLQYVSTPFKETLDKGGHNLYSF